MIKKKNFCRQFGWLKPKESVPWKIRLRLQDDIKMGLRTIGWASVKWIYLAQERQELWGVVATGTTSGSYTMQGK